MEQIKSLGSQRLQWIHHCVVAQSVEIFPLSWTRVCLVRNYVNYFKESFFADAVKKQTNQKNLKQIYDCGMSGILYLGWTFTMLIKIFLSRKLIYHTKLIRQSTQKNSKIEQFLFVTIRAKNIASVKIIKSENCWAQFMGCFTWGLTLAP